jgi:sugar phosphate isomerase/epimerase
MKLGIVTYELGRDWDVPTLIERLPTLGYAGVELRTTHAHGVEESLDAIGRAEIRQRFADSPLEVVGIGTTYEYHSIDTAVVEANIEGTRRACELARDIGASGVKVRPNGDQVAAGIPKLTTLHQIGMALRECGRTAADNGVVIRLEMHGSVGDAVDMRQIIDITDHPNVVLCWNSNTRFDVGPDGTVATDYRLVADRIGLVHLHDLTDAGYPWPELLRLLEADEYDGWCLAECAPASSDPARVLSYFRSLYDAYRELGRRGAILAPTL